MGNLLRPQTMNPDLNTMLQVRDNKTLLDVCSQMAKPVSTKLKTCGIDKQAKTHNRKKKVLLLFLITLSGRKEMV